MTLDTLDPARRGIAPAWPLLLCMIVAAVLTLWSGRLPTPLPMQAPPADFSAMRAMTHVERIAARPHAAGSPEIARVRGYLIAQARALGLAVEVQSGVGVSTTPRFPAFATAGSMRNVIATLPGRDRTLPAIVLMAHYDSVPNSPGAADDTIGVASLLETARAIKATGQPLRDIVFAFTDGEEPGLLGSALFFSRLNERGPIGLVLNFEARGDGGRAAMFETGPDAGNLVRLYAAKVAMPAADSLAASLYRLLPNNTDFTHALEHGAQGLNFAIADAQVGYHTMISTPAHLDRGSVQHMGDQALAMTRALANLRTLPSGGGDLVYADLFGTILVYYPAVVGWVLIAIAALLTGFGMVRLGKRKQLALLGILHGIGWFCVVTLIAALLLGLAGSLVGMLLQGHGGESALLARIGWFEAGCMLISGAVLLGAAHLALASPKRSLTCGAVVVLGGVASAIAGWSPLPAAFALISAILLFFCLKRPIEIFGAWAGTILVVLLFAIVVQILLPGAAFLFAWPVVVAAVAFALLAARAEPTRAARPIALALTAIGFAHLAGQAHGTFVTVGSAAPQAIAPFCGLALLMLMPWLLPFARTRPSAAMTGAAMASGVGLSLLAALLAPRLPIAAEVFHFTDASSARQYRASAIDAPDAWTLGALGQGRAARRQAIAPAFEQPVWLSPAAPAPVTAPSIATGYDAGAGRLRIRVRPGGPGQFLHIHIRPSVVLTRPAIDGQAASMRLAGGQWAEIRYAVAPPAGVLLSFAAPARGSIELRVLEMNGGWPKGTAALPPMPASVMPWRAFGMTEVLARKHIAWGGTAR